MNRDTLGSSLTLPLFQTDLPDGLCPVAPSKRVDCGIPTTTKEECLGNSCCWDPTVTGTAWCFNQPSENITQHIICLIN